MNLKYKIPTDAEFLEFAHSVSMCFPVDGEQSRPDDSELAAKEIKQFGIKVIRDSIISLQVVDESTDRHNEQETS